MHHRALFVITLIFIFFLSQFSCNGMNESVSEISNPGNSGGNITIVTEDDSGGTIKVPVGGILQIELAGAGSTGHRWYFDVLDEKHMKIIDKYTRKITQEKIEGAPVMGIWKLMTQKIGTTYVEMVYRRSWEKDVAPAGRFTMTVEITASNNL